MGRKKLDEAFEFDTIDPRNPRDRALWDDAAKLVINAQVDEERIANPTYYELLRRQFTEQAIGRASCVLRPPGNDPELQLVAFGQIVPQGDSIWEFDNIAVHHNPNLRRKGLGRLLVGKMEELAAARRVTIVGASAHTPESRVFLKRLGYISAANNGHYFKKISQ